MKSKLLFAVLLLTSLSALATGPTIYRNTGKSTLSLDCDLPTTREDGTPLLISELAVIDWFVEGNPQPVYSDLGLACHVDIDLTTLADGQHNVYATATDTDDLTSTKSNGYPFVLATKSRPKAPHIR